MSKKSPQNNIPLRGVITGGIGAGKTTVAKIFEVLGVPIFNADSEAKKLMNHSPKLKAAIINLLGSEAYSGENLNRSFVAQKIFSDDTLRRGLNEIVHPAVGAAFNSWASNQEGPFVLNEAAIAFETGMYKRMDFTILVTAPEDLRINRIMKRDGLNHAEVKGRMDSQWPEDKKRNLADYIIENNEEDALIPQVLRVFEQLSGKKV